jgi:hypothetical protein
MYDEIKPRGAIKGSNPDAGGAVLREVPVFAVVKDNIDPTRSGRLQVYVSDIGSQDPDDANGWVTVKYMSPFYGLTEGSGGKATYGNYLDNPHSYGVWNSPPDIGSTVICLFVNGDPNFGYYIGCVPNAEALHMVPAIGGGENIVANAGEAAAFGGATRLPVVNLNNNNSSVSDSTNYLSAPKPVHSYQASILSQQGLIRDPIRGVISTSAQRESPSRVGYGISTPGRPVYEGGYTDEQIADAAKEGSPGKLKVIGRRGGHTFVMDDGDSLGRDQLVRLRTATGHQILMSDDGQCLFIIHSNGQSWIELGKEGTIDMYATNSVNIRTQGDLNLHADNNININAAKALNISAESIAMTSEKETTMRVGTDFSQYTIGKYTVKVNGSMSQYSASEGSYASKSTMYINGEKINLNTGSASTVPQEVKPLPVVAHTDTLFDSVKGWAAAPGKLLSIVSRAPAHAPWAMSGQGVDVKVNNNASAALPSAPAPALVATNSSVATTQTPGVTPAVVSTIPNTGQISAAVDKNTTAAIIGQSAVLAQTGIAANVIKQTGAGVVQTAQGAVAAIGKMAQSPAQLEAAGVLKPGASQLVNTLVAGGKTVEQAMTNNLFTGKSGAETLNAYVTNPVAQVQAQVANLQQAQTQLTQAGIITGTESGTQLGGLLLATATAGISNVTNFVKNAAQAAGQAVTGIVGGVGKAVNGLLGPLQNTLSAGNFASNLASTVTGGLSSIAGALGGATAGAIQGIAGLANAAKGIAASAFSAVTKGFATIKSGIPQNLKDITEKAQAANALSADSPPAFTTDPITGEQVRNFTADQEAAMRVSNASLNATLTNAVNNGIGNPIINTVANASASVGSLVNVVSSVNGSSVTNLVRTTTGTVSTALASVGAITGVSTGLNAIAGGEKAVASVVDNAKNAINLIPGASSITGLINSTGATATAGLAKLKDGTATLQSLASAGLPAGAAAQLNSAISSLSSGGSISIQLPTVAFNTVDRGELTAQITSTLGSAKIPLPNFSGNPATLGKPLSEESLSKYAEINDELNTLVDQRFELDKSVRDARYALNIAKTDLPAGDPAIAIAEQTLNQTKQQLKTLDDRLVEIRNRQAQLATAPPGNSVNSNTTGVS